MSAAARRIVTLSTDIGSEYAAQIKGVLLSAAPEATVVDLSLDLPAHRIMEAAFLVLHMARGFPSGTIHLVVVDPGVGGERAPLAVRCRESRWLVGPDNGTLVPLGEALGVEEVVRIDPNRLHVPRVSATFEGRDVFAWAAAALANGAAGPEIGGPAALSAFALPTATRTPRGAHGAVVHIDRFGNVITNVPTDWGPDPGASCRVQFGRRPRRSLRRVRTYADLPKGGAGIIGSSFGLLEVSAREQPMAERWTIRPGDSVRFEWGGRRRPASAKTG
jgi:S-adenosyl-L-methionine hydrolase (adenosine-forming)